MCDTFSSATAELSTDVIEIPLIGTADGDQVHSLSLSVGL